MAYDKVDTLSDYVFWPEINSLIEFPQQEILWSPFENKASAATFNEADRKKKKSLADPHECRYKMACFDLKGRFCLAFKIFSAGLPKNFIAFI